MTSFKKKDLVFIVYPSWFNDADIERGVIVATDEPCPHENKFQDILVQPEGVNRKDEFLQFSPEGIERFRWLLPAYITPDTGTIPVDETPSRFSRLIRKLLQAIHPGIPPSPKFS